MTGSSCSACSQKDSIVFEEFIQSGLDDSHNPFVTPSSRNWGKHLPLKMACVAGIFLLVSFLISFQESMLPLAHCLLLFVYFLSGMPALCNSTKDLLSLDINIGVLMTLAAFSSVLIGGEFEGALLLVLFSLSGALEHSVDYKARGELRNLHKLSPTQALLIQEDGTTHAVSLRDIKVGAHILVKAGELVPLDGTVIEGTSSVSLVHLTGENIPVFKEKGNDIPAGARNIEGALVLEVSHTSADSTLTRIIKLITEAQEARPKFERWLKKMSKRYASSIIFIAFIVSFSFPFLFGIPFLGNNGSIYRALAFLIAASPCALIIAIPIVYLSAVGSCARNGILLKGGVTLDKLATCKAIAFDKTGTLTTGDLSCIEVKSLNNSPHSQELIISVAAALERNAVHPIANAIVNYAQEKQISLIKLEEFQSIPGYGLEGKISIHDEIIDVAIGKTDFITPKMTDHERQELEKQMPDILAQGDTVTVLLFDNHATMFRFRDQLRSDIKSTIDELHKTKELRLLMLTGDHDHSAKRNAEALGLDEYYSSLTPEDKLKHVSSLANDMGLVMVGDGLNDAPALARATVGIAMGQVGSSTAIDASDVVLLKDNIQLISWLMQKAKTTQKVVKQNIFFAFSVLFFASILSLSGSIPLWLSVILHEGSTVLVGLNGLRLLRN
ncbi:MAG: heavy metal translocating P-type ATPase [Waddliaceae bacterium]|nr:heavy metal translocating P-type ATPase [Waddliaceae bacterium]